MSTTASSENYRSMTEPQPEHRLALRIEEKYGVGTEISDSTIAKMGNAMGSLQYFDAGTFLRTMEQEAMLKKTKKGINSQDDTMYALVPGWNAGVSREEIRRQMTESIPDDEATQSGFEEFE